MISGRMLAFLSTVGSAWLLFSTAVATAAPLQSLLQAEQGGPLPIEQVYCDRNPYHHGGVYDRFGCWHSIDHGYCDRRPHHGGFYVHGCWYP